MMSSQGDVELWIPKKNLNTDAEPSTNQRHTPKPNQIDPCSQKMKYPKHASLKGK